MSDFDAQDHERDEEEALRRPRVVDKRISARRQAAPPSEEATPPPAREATETAQPADVASAPEPQATGPQPAATPQDSPEAAPPGAGSASAGAGEEPLWTPQQEEQMRRMAEDMARIPSVEWVVNFAVNLANVAGVKLQSGHMDEAQLAIDAFGGLLEATGARLGEAEQPLRQTLAQLHMAFAQGPPPASPSGNPTP